MIDELDIKTRDMVPIDRPLFRSVDEALRWAFQTRDARPVQGSHILVPFMKKDRLAEEGGEESPVKAMDPGLDRIPPGLDTAGQAGMLQSFCHRQPRPRNLHLLAKYAHGEERMAARRALREFLIPLLRQSVKPRYVIYMLVCRYYGKRDIVFKDLAFKLVPLVERKDDDTDASIHRKAWSQVKSLAREVDSWCKQISVQTEVAADEQLRLMGVVG